MMFNYLFLIYFFDWFPLRCRAGTALALVIADRLNSLPTQEQDTQGL